MSKSLGRLIYEEIIDSCDTNKTLYVYDVTEFRMNQGLVNDYDIEDLKQLDGYQFSICDYEFVVSDKEFANLDLVYKFEE